VRIGELADAVGVNPKTIRFYEDIALLPQPERRPSGYRDYSEDDRDRLVFVRTAQRLGLALADIKEILAFRERGEQPCGYVRSVLARQAGERRTCPYPTAAAAG
jgi:DNA-binding transcriptional MerR regulator